ncbi:MAG TPA: TlpA disulfide reductase family protein [Candidatus Binatia bacterium]|nr:TlpA disulfide reductase family protein [Candidatus Binatia bacterium]
MTRGAAFGAILCAFLFLLLTGDVRADPSRFIPWKEPAAPSLALNDLAGRSHTLDDYRGNVVLVNFWATWCEPCRDELASIQALQQRLAGRPFVILLVNYGESRARVGEFVKRESISFPILLDPNQEAPRAWRVRVLPSSFLIAPDGRVRYSVIGEIDWAGVEAANLVQRLWR